MSPVDDPILQNGEECGASGGDLGYFPLALSFQDDFVANGCYTSAVHRYVEFTTVPPSFRTSELGSPPPQSDLGTYPPGTDIWWSSLETCSNLFT